MNVIVCSNKHKVISEIVREQGYKVTGFDRVLDLATFVIGDGENVIGKPTTADKLLILDSGISSIGSEVSVDFSALGKVLKDNFFNVGEVIYLNKTENKSHFNFVKFLIEQENLPIQLVTVDVINEMTITSALANVKEYEYSGEPEKKKIIKIKRGLNPIEKNSLKRYETDQTLLLEYSTVSGVDKNNLIQVTSQKHIEDLDELPDNLEEVNDYINKLEENKLEEPNMIIITGPPKSGVTTLAMKMAEAASENEKVLLIDMNHTNLGLSFLTKSIWGEDFEGSTHFINIYKMLEDKKELLTQVYSVKPLHVMTLDLPFTNSFDEVQFEFILLGMLKSLPPIYSKIIIDIPLDLMKYYSRVVEKSDRIIITTSPYVKDLVGIYNILKQGKVIQSNKLKSEATEEIEGKNYKICNNIIIAQTATSLYSEKINIMSNEKYLQYTEKYFNLIFRKTGIIIIKENEKITKVYKQLVQPFRG